VLVACDEPAPPVVTPPATVAPPSPAARPPPVRPRAVASIGARVVDSFGSVVPAEAVLARRVRKAVEKQSLPACAPPGVVDVAAVLADGVEVVERKPVEGNGRVVFKALAEGEYVTWAESDTHRTASFPVTVAFLHQELGQVVIAPRRALTVTVRSSFDEALEGAEVLVIDAAGVVAKAVSNASGRAEFKGVPDSGVAVVASKAGHASSSSDVHDGATEAGLALALRGARSVAVLAQGVPVPDVTVRVRSAGQGVCEAKSDAGGVAQFPDLAIADLTASATRGNDGAAAPIGRDAQAVLHLGPAMRLKVTVSGTGGRALAADVALTLPDGTERRTSTNDDGSVLVDGIAPEPATPGLVKLAASAPGHTPAMLELPWKAAELTVLMPLAPALPVDCLVLDDPAAAPGSLRVFLAPVKSALFERRALRADGSAWFDDEVPEGRWRCEAVRDGKTVGTSREFDHPQSPNGSAMRLDATAR